MNRRQVILLVMGVIAFHVGLFWLLGSAIRPLPPRRFPAPVQTDLRVREAPFTHPDTGEELVYREIRVSTKLAYPDFLMKQRDGSTNPSAMLTQDETVISYER